MAIQIFVDSTAYLSAAHLQKYNIQVLSLSVNFEDEALEEQGANYDYFYQKLATAKQLPTSSQPNVHGVTESFKLALEKGDDILVVTLSSEMSGTYQTARMVAQDLLESYPERRVEVFDSRTNCMQLGFIALAGAEALAGGSTLDQALGQLVHTRDASRFIFTVDTLKYLEKGGRIGKASAFLGGLLNIKPILTVNDGRTDAMGKVRSRGKAISFIADQVLADIEKYGFKRACIHHIAAPEAIEALKASLPSYITNNIEIVSIGPVIGTHVGPGAIGIVYETQQIHQDK